MPPVVELRGVSKTYPGPPPVEALRPSDLTIRQGELVAVVGASGSGKSTLLHLLGLLDRPSQGDYLLDGRSTSELDEADRCGLRAHTLGFVFQSFHLLHRRTAVENVELGLLHQQVPRADRRARALDVLDQVGLGHRAWSTPAQMSGGEQQRVALARAIVRRPALLLCDEPTGNLDSANTAQVLELVTGLNADGLTVVLITHDPAVALGARRHVEVLDGRLTERLAPA